MIQPRWVAVLLWLVLFLFSFHNERLGIDFGENWDEWQTLKSVDRVFKDGIVLPHWYRYPSVLFDMSLLAAISDTRAIRDAIQGIPATPDDPFAAMASGMRRSIAEKSYLLRARSWVSFLTLLTSLWIFLFILKMRNSPQEALLGSALFLTAWEVNYQARWLATENLTTLFSFMTQYLLLLSIRSSRLGGPLILLSALSAGLATGSYYPSGIFLLLVLLTAVGLHSWGSQPGGPFATLRTIGMACIVFFLTFILTTPGMIIEPAQFIRDVLSESIYYHGGHEFYRTTPGLYHFFKIFQYISVVSFSKYTIISIMLSIFFCVGFYNFVVDEKISTSIWFFLAPVFHMIYLSQQDVMIVQRHLVLFPYLCVLTARGAVVTAAALQPFRRLRHMVIGAVILSLCFNMVWQNDSARAIAVRNDANQPQEVRTYMEKHGNNKFLLTPSVIKLLNLSADSLPPHVTQDGGKADQVLFQSKEIESLGSNWIAQKPGTYTIVSPQLFEVNWDYYPGWRGDNRVIAVERQTARHIGLIP
ncbi:MAG: hypothetical protein HQL63_00205 [Magnetococcales bacterium]|nr:hypothetical protein [Magnetococcales bacterium]